MVLNFFPTGMNKLKIYGSYYINGNLEYNAIVKRYLDADLEVKRILKSNKMELEDLFQALAIQCYIPCIIEFVQVDCCSQYVSLIHV